VHEEEVGEMKIIYLIHGWGESPKSEAWFKWLNEESKKRNYKLIIPEMPNTNNPKIDEWLNKLNNIIKPNEDTYLIGHSIGCRTIMRYLEKLPKEIKFRWIIFVAGWFNLLESAYEDNQEKYIAKPWLEIPINAEKVKQHTDKVLAIFSDNDPCVPLSDSKIFREKLGAKVIIKKNEEHFNDTIKIKEMLNFIER